MKKKLLPLAILAGLAGAAGTAQAVHVNDDGLGEVLIYPYYTVEGEQDTTFTIVNTTDRAKAVKVRLLEAMNSWEVIDFNLYLSPQDHWTGVITASDETDGAILVTPDTSCTVPAIPAEGAELRNLLFSDNGGANDNADGGPSEVSRTREGYIEIIEMGTLDDTAPGQFGAEAAVTHTSSGVPSDCSVVVGGWETVPANSIDPNDIVGEWGPGQGGNTANMVFEDAGGLYGYGTIVNVTEGTNATYDAVALDNFAATILHARPGDTAPNLGSGIPNADIIDGNTVVSAVFTESLDAVTALFMHDTLSNDYVLDSVISAGTDWVVTMPTKNEYVNLPTAADPFLSVWDNGAACEEVQFSQWNREEQTPGEDPIAGGVDFSPSPIPEDVVVTGFALCSEANVISFFGPDVEKDADGNPISGYSSALQPSGRVQYGFDVEFENGWARLDLGQDAASNPRTLTSDNAVTFSGLPVVGFAVQKFSNNTVGDGAFYAGVVSHKATRDISN